MRGGVIHRDARILIVEDEYLIALDEQTRLATMGFSNVSLASSGELATDKVRTMCPDLVLMNVNLGEGISGVQAAEIIRSQCNARIVFVSAYSPARVGVTDQSRFLRKPFSDNDFRRMMEYALA